MNANDTVTGKIDGVRDYGSIFIVFVDQGDGKIATIPFDHRCFVGLLEGEGCRPADLVGREISYDGETVNFLD